MNVSQIPIRIGCPKTIESELYLVQSRFGRAKQMRIWTFLWASSKHEDKQKEKRDEISKNLSSYIFTYGAGLYSIT